MSSRPCYLLGAAFRSFSRPPPSRQTNAIHLWIFARPVQRSSWAGFHLSAVANVRTKPHSLRPRKARSHDTTYGTAHRALCYKCGKPGHLARDCDKPVATCYRCGESGHEARDCPQPQRCYRCGKPGHTASQCSSEVDTRICLSCGAVGHVRRDCPRRRLCYRCGEPGHKASECSAEVGKTTESFSDHPGGLRAFLSRLFWGRGRS